MLANWVKETTNTSGTGTITLAGAATGFRAFSTALANGAKVRYSIKDGNNREAGIGTFTLAGTTLSRDVIIQKLVSGTFTDGRVGGTTAISLSGSAAEVYISALDQNFPGRVVQLTGIGAGAWKSWDNIIYWNIVGDAMVADRLLLKPVFTITPTVITSLVFYISTADASETNFRIGIWDCDDIGNPGPSIYRSGDLSSVVATTGQKDHTVSGGPIYLAAGRYWVGGVSAGGVVAPRSWDKNTATGHTLNASDFANRYIRDNGVTGALPDVPTVDGFGDDTGMGIGWK